MFSLGTILDVKMHKNVLESLECFTVLNHGMGRGQKLEGKRSEEKGKEGRGRKSERKERTAGDGRGDWTRSRAFQF